MLVAHQRTGQKSRLAQNLEPVADTEHGPTGARVRRHRPEHRRKPGDGARTQVVAVAESAGQDHRIGEQAVAHRAGFCRRFFTGCGLDLQDQMLAGPDTGDLTEAERLERVLDRLTLGIEQRRARHHPDLYRVRAHAAPGRRGPPPPAPPRYGWSFSSMTNEPAITASSSSAGALKKPSRMARPTP